MSGKELVLRLLSQQGTQTVRVEDAPKYCLTDSEYNSSLAAEHQRRHERVEHYDGSSEIG